MKLALDRERELRYTWKSLLKMEKDLGLKIMEIGTQNFGLTEIVKIAYYGLIHEDSNLTFDKFVELLDTYNVNVADLSEAVGEALKEAFGNRTFHAKK